MYAGRPTTESGSFTMTTLALKSAFGGSGNASNGYYSASFDRFCNSLDAFRDRVEAQYVGSIYQMERYVQVKPLIRTNGV